MKRDNASILVVDDDPALLHSLKEILEAEGYEVTTAADGESGLRCLKEQAFDLVLSDLALPGLDGMELLKYLRREAPGLPLHHHHRLRHHRQRGVRHAPGGL